MGNVSSYGSSIIYSILLTSIILSITKVDADLEKLPFCSDNSVDNRRLIFVSTLDGKLSALNSHDGGKLVWSVDTGPGPMLSSSIHQLELTNNGQWVRMIPSLSGGLYKFDRDSIEPVPVTAESLLSSSYRYSDDLVIAGGRETRSYGVSKRTGRVLYECTVHGCTNVTLTSEDDDFEHSAEDVLILQRLTQTVRAVEPRSGTERWNFSVAQHELELVSPTQCITKRNNQDIIPINLEYRVIVPEGLLCAVSRDNPNVVIWKHKFESPIVSAWQQKHQSLQTLNLFSGSGWTWSSDNVPISPSLYIGMHKKQLYIQESVKMQQLIPKVAQVQQLIHIPWKPYPAGKNALAVLGDRSVALDAESSIEGKTTAIAVLYGTEYVNGNGYYLFTPEDLADSDSALCDKQNASIESEPSGPDIVEEDTEDTTTDNIVIVSLWFWWKEVLVISMTSALVLNVLVTRRSSNERRSISKFEKWMDSAPLLPGPGPEERRSAGRSISESISSTSSNVSETSYSSRFLADFEPLACLGKGGFGVVFEAKNKIDDCNYAIKRITLPYRHESRERVMREVRTLAKLEHSNIVRYFQAWTENPPAGWQQETDKALAFKEVLYAAVDIETPSPTFSKPFLTNTKTSVKSDVFFRDPLRDEVFDSMLSSRKSDISKRTKSQSLNDDCSDSFIVFKSDTQDESVDKKIKCNAFNNNDSKSYSSSANYNNMCNTASYSKTNVNNTHSSMHNIVNLVPSRDTDTNTSTNANSIYTRKTHKRPMSLDLTANFKKPEPMPTVYLYIQMQLCQKQSLKEWLINNRQAERQERVLSIFEQIVDAVEYVHLQGLIHRDLKPSNIFFSLDGQIKIGDFGLVTTMSQTPCDADQRIPCDNELKLGVCDKHTQQVGTHLYMSPEQLQGHAYNYKVDIYSLGLILFELLVEFGTEMERITTLQDIRKYKFPNGFPETFQKEFQLLKLMLSKEPHKRPTTYGIKARPPLNKTCSNEEWHFELPPRLSHSPSLDSCS